MCDIHNNPKLAEPRMPVLLDEKGIERWLNEKDVSINEINSDISLVAHTVKRFSGRPNAGNLPDSDEEFHYPEFNKGLFD